jgi:hypothetical protein
LSFRVRLFEWIDDIGRSFSDERLFENPLLSWFLAQGNNSYYECKFFHYSKDRVKGENERKNSSLSTKIVKNQQEHPI